MRRLLLATIAGWVLAGAAGADPETLFREGNALLTKKMYAEALQKYEQGLAEEPKGAGLLYNAGLSAYFLGNYPVAIEHWKLLKHLDPTDWRLRTKLIQAYQASGLEGERRSEQEELVNLWKVTANPEFKAQDSYTMDQFKVGDRQVLTRVPFQSKPDRKVLYKFLITKPGVDDLEDYYLSLGSYEATTQFARESGQIKANERLYHLDQYLPRGHATFAMVAGLPAYNEVKQWVRDIVEGKRKPATSSSY